MLDLFSVLCFSVRVVVSSSVVTLAQCLSSSVVQGSSLVAICVCTAKEHVSYHLALHYHLILTRCSGAALAAVERVSDLLYLSDTNVDLW